MAFLRKMQKAQQKAVVKGDPVISDQQIDVQAQKGMKQTLGSLGPQLIANMPMSQKISALKAAYSAAAQAGAGIRNKLGAQRLAADQARFSDTMARAEREKDRRRQNVQAFSEFIQEGPAQSIQDLPYEKVLNPMA